MSNLPVHHTIDKWHTPASDYPRCQKGNHRISSHTYKKGTYRNWGVCGIDYVELTKPAVITELSEYRNKAWHNWMVDDMPQWWAMEEYARQSFGHVLVAGLGLGLYIHALILPIKTGVVERVTVVEISEDVIDLMQPNLPARLPSDCLSIVNDDFYRYIEHPNLPDFDTIVVDLWVTHGREEKVYSFIQEVLPLQDVLRKRWPNARLCFHGFVTTGDMRLWSEDFKPHILE